MPQFYISFIYLCSTSLNINDMAKNLINKYVWLVETIYKAKRITFEELNEKWLENYLSEGIELALRTFHKWRIAAEEMFGLVIECERKGGYHYYIANSDELKGGNIRNWLLNTISVSNVLIDNQHMKDRILLEEIPSGQEYLSEIIEAMKKGCCITITYQSYWKCNKKTFDVEPYCVKLFKQRWYLVGRSPYYDKIMIYALDRIIHMYANDVSFKMPQSFQPANFFKEYYGVIVEEKAKMETILLKVPAGQANYLRSLPIHTTQVEEKMMDDYSIFKLNIRPTFDFMQEILKHGEDMEILSPEWLRKDMTERIKRMCNIYNKEDI